MTTNPDTSAKKVRGKGITIRLAECEADIDALVELGRALHAEDINSCHPYSAERVKKLGMRAIGEDRGHYAVIVAEKEGQIIGLLLGHIAMLYYSEDVTASAMLFYVKPEWRNTTAAVKLLHGFKRWARAGNAKGVSVHVTSGVKMRQTDRLLKRLGFVMVGGNYTITHIGI